MRGECFAARYALDDAGFRELEPAAIWTLEKIAQNIQEKTWVVGPGALRYEAEIKKAGALGQWVSADLHRPSALSLARVAYLRWKAGERPGLETLKPLYIRLPSVEEKKA
jgi:tRNA A37 threonylcarbamoyladenosine modification protein TsaB